ncbi:hypothetical protein [Caldimonas brevitalea]|uniref:Uncharacterized protein n=1 Tax=Caldimonas brevitalea TaxID=413882 RepID=A0A0G3BDN3_9BURK|nr:hypothetical protein [Caldimonas brevitalea]AKJ27392.1 hypothetical protein AAW51_0701 [Caldimonas brevitalea]
MTLKTLTLALAVTGVAASYYMKKRRAQMLMGGADVDQLDASQRALGNAQAMQGLGADSPNTAERLHEENLTGSPLGAGSPLADKTASDDLFSSSSQRGPNPTTPGLPDLTRGA